MNTYCQLQQKCIYNKCGIENNGEKIIMKLVQIIFVLLLTSIICHLAAAAPNLDYLTIDDCRSCHGDEDGNTIELHHESEENCLFCHTSFPDFLDGWRNCDNCHADFDHHEDAKRRCSDCHDDKQQMRQ
ncbi:MAG: hypothetical protein MIO93_11770 [ANME-2 cluster archaeon]|nr:hypothetical protein [ANME-2 cluster archaeon]